MPAPLAVDWNEVRTLALAVGVREAARRMEISEDAVMQRSKREGWLADQHEARAALSTSARDESRSKALITLGADPLSAVSAADALDYRQHGKPARLALAAAQRKQAERLATMDEDELIQPEVAGVMVASVKVGNTLHGWSGSAQPATIRLELLARGAGNGPVIDAEMVVDAQLVEGDDDQG